MSGYIPDWEQNPAPAPRPPRPSSSPFRPSSPRPRPAPPAPTPVPPPSPKPSSRKPKHDYVLWMLVGSLAIVAICIVLVIVDPRRFGIAWIPIAIFVFILICLIRNWFDDFEKKHPGWGCLIMLIPVVAVIGGCVYFQKKEEADKARWAAVLEERRKEEAAKKAEETRRAELQREEQRKKWAALAQPLPASGRVRVFRSGVRNSPFEIKSSHGANYLLKLVDLYTRETVMTVFVRGGTPTEVDVPSGTYEIRYASGTTWYGDELLFGPDTSCSKANQSFSFSSGRGYTITLYKVHNGNLSTSSMSPADF